MRIMCDTTIIMDVLFDRRPYAEDASALLTLCEMGKTRGFIVGTAVSDIYYLVRKSTGSADDAKHALRKLLEIVKVCSLTNTDVLGALDLSSPDFDKCIVAACAVSIGCDCIATRQKTAYEGLGVPVRTPGEIVHQVQESR